jgi:hypothetical protein
MFYFERKLSELELREPLNFVEDALYEVMEPYQD